MTTRIAPMHTVPLRRKPPRRRRIRNALLIGSAVTTVVAVTVPTAVSAGQSVVRHYQESRPEFKSQYGSWSLLNVPSQFRVNAVHSALLPTGKVLMIAGSGNNADNFTAGSFATLLWDPKTNVFSKVATPADLFCGGHAFLPNGNLLVAGGTRKYEVLASKVTNAAGVTTVKNENPDDAAFPLAKGTLVTGRNGRSYRTTEDIVVPPAAHHLMNGQMMTMPSSTQVWVEAIDKGRASVVPGPSQYAVSGLTGGRARNVYMLADKLTLDKQEYRGINGSYEFNPFTEQYVKTGNLNYSRWYPTLVGTKNGVLAVSGLDQYGKILPGNNELYVPTLRRWFDKPGLFRYFPTYPSLFRIQGGDGNKLFYSGMNTGYGPATVARTPGIWDLTTNRFAAVPGLRDPGMNETGASLLLAPAQDQKVMVLGGGGVGDQDTGTARTDVVDLKAPRPHFTPGPDLAVQTRYLNTTILPDDQVFATGGSAGYRGRNDSDVLSSYLYNPTSNRLDRAAPPHVGRDYHSDSILLPDGRVMVLGSDPLYRPGTNNQVPGSFEQRIEIYSPPSLFHGRRPTLVAPKELVRGTTFGVTVNDPTHITSARLVRPSASTHVTNVEQRSVRLDITPCAGTRGHSCCCNGPGSTNLKFSLDRDESLTPSGYYMIFVTNQAGVSSQAGWTHVQ